MPSRRLLPLLPAAAALALASSALAAAPAPAWDPSAPAPYAQQLVERTLSRHPGLRILAFHVTPPGRAENMIVASNIGRIGKLADADDLSVLHSGAPRAERTKTGCSVELPLLDAARRPIGVVGITFSYTEGEDPKAITDHAVQVRDELAGQIPSLASLFAAPGAAGS